MYANGIMVLLEYKSHCACAHDRANFMNTFPLRSAPAEITLCLLTEDGGAAQAERLAGWLLMDLHEIE